MNLAGDATLPGRHGGFTLPYLEYIEVSLKTPQFPEYEEKILMLVIPDSKYTHRVPVQIGTRVIAWSMKCVVQENPPQVVETCGSVYTSTVMAQKASVDRGLQETFDLEAVKGPIMTTKEVVLGPFETHQISGASKVTGHSKWVNIMAEPPDTIFSNQVVATSTYGELQPGSSRIGICLQNLMAAEVKIPAKVAVGQIQAVS